MGQQIKIGTNINSLSVQRRLAESAAGLGKTYERLSSGQRINSAADDAAGLAIAEGLNVRQRIYQRGLQNLNDGVSLLAIAGSALGALTDITTRISELAAQSANGCYSNDQRAALDIEAQALAKEYFRISRSASFNGLRVFDGTIQGLSLQAGIGTDGVLQSSLGGKLGTGALRSPTTVGLGAMPYTVTLGDLNGDGNLDMVAANYSSDTVSVLLGNGDGTFKPKSDLGTGTNPRMAALGDLNGDGCLDIVSANGNSANVSVLLGNGDGSFKAAVNYAAGPSPRSIAFNDINGDGFLDVISAGGLTGGTTVLLGNGDGTLKAKSEYAPGTEPYSAVLGDINGDGVSDIVTANQLSDTVSVLLGKGDGTFKPNTDFAAGDGPWTAALGDLNNDGRLDAVTANLGSDNVSVFMGNGDGTFKPRVDLASGSLPWGLALGDMNGDGNLDIVNSNYTGDTASVFLGVGDGTFAPRTNYSTGASSDPDGIVLGDVNNDGVLDLVTANQTSDNASILLGSTRDGVAPVLPFSLRTKADTRQAMSIIRRNADGLGIQRGILGAFESRLASAISLLGVSAENFKAAEARIKDADIAQEAANLVRLRILEQAGAAVLGQANQSPQLALTLLQW